MDINTAGAGAGDVTPSGAFCQWTSSASLSFQHFLDKTTPYLLYRWIAFFFIAVLYVVRVYLVEGFYVISYALGIYLLNLLIGFLSPQVDPELQDLSDGPTLPTRETDEFRPFVRRLPEFKFWERMNRGKPQTRPTRPIASTPGVNPFTIRPDPNQVRPTALNPGANPYPIRPSARLK
ncbi:protein RER1A-like isoform X3 [Solanum pennellii]|uniref:Protein RER1A-like isoform X3 n=1 Tax=Solanum pennellii TaxID=28526 RepID=A0ABM1G4I0_SOLPN|nr:protein RER1A-like isoform X3 [Solanum pennellii]